MTDTMTTTSTWAIDTSHSQVEFAVKHMMVSTVKGSFTRFNGTIVLDEQNMANSTASVEIDPTSIDTRDAKRDEHLRGADFFGVENNPTLTFVSTSVVPDGDDLKVDGDMTVNGNTKQVELEAEFEGRGMSPFGMEVIGFSGKTKIKREDCGITWNSALETGGVLVGNEVKITLHIEAVPAQQG